MSVLIKGIEIPKRHLFEAFVAIGDGQIVVKDLEKNKLFEGKIEEIPTPHGRLIDAEVAETAYPLMKHQLMTIPTIIEAEESE